MPDRLYSGLDAHVVSRFYETEAASANLKGWGF